jgi:carbon dioxide concentrating mechanism protein CcmL
MRFPFSPERPGRAKGRPVRTGKERREGMSMQLARVVGSVVATRKEESLQGLKLLVVRPLDEEGRESGNAIISADAVGAGPEEIVLIAAGSSARQTVMTDKRPVDSVIMAIVDSWNVGDALKYKK